MYQETKIIEQAKKLSKVLNNITLEEIDLNNTEGIPTYDGSFKTIYNMVKENKIKLLTRNGVVVGISVDSGTGSLEKDNLAAENFSKVYSIYTVRVYMGTTMMLLKAGVEVNDIVEEKNSVKIYLYREGKILNEYGETIVELSDEDLEGVTMDNIREVLDEAYNAKYASKQEHTAPRAYNVDNVVISADEAHNVDISSTSSIKRYLRNKYQRYLQGGCVPQAVRNDDGSITISDIAWGRTMSRDEKINH